MKSILFLFLTLFAFESQAGVTRRFFMQTTGICLAHVAVGNSKREISVPLAPSSNLQVPRLGLQSVGMTIAEYQQSQGLSDGAKEQWDFQDLAWNKIRETRLSSGVIQVTHPIVFDGQPFQLEGVLRYDLRYPFRDLRRGIFLEGNGLVLKADSDTDPWTLLEVQSRLNDAVISAQRDLLSRIPPS